MSTISEIRDLGRYAGQSVAIRGWVFTSRTHGKVGFLVVRDGTGVVQCVAGRKEVDPEVWERLTTVTLETSVVVTGIVRRDDRAPGGYELGLTDLEVVGTAEDYPIQPKEHGIDFLLDHRHLWLRSRQQRAILRVRHHVEQAIHDFFFAAGFVRIDTPILTGAAGESGGMFETDYFGERAFLAQTGQLYLEAAAAAFGKVYCFGPTFRAEKSKTRRHLTEFWMVEPEVAWFDTEDNMRLQEEFVSYIVARTLERCEEDLAELGRDTKPL
ncbi:MAG TPA: amino acid--tRNA ligase-related protein, partial [Longimicrobiales bacterium]|nr:amino acid--tRNA ligase-related protein [Longimicrobiales bacterium]